MVNINSVFIVEDNRNWMGIFEELFSSKFSCRIVGKDNLYDAVEAIKIESFDLYVTDGDYPLNHGAIVEKGACFKFYEELIKINHQARVVIITGRTENKTKAEELGIISYYKGRLDINDLAERLEDI